MKYVAILLGLYGAYWYVAKHYEFKDTLAYAKKHPGASWAPATDYYVGLAYYQREDYQMAQQAFSQLLEDYPTCHYQASALFFLEDSAEYNRDWETAATAVTTYLEEFPKGKDIEIMTKRKELLHYQHGLNP